MGRVTRRSVASKDSTPKESPKSASRRGAKKEEPAEEATGSQETPKRRGRQPAKEEPTPDVPAKGKTTRGRSTSRKSEEPKVEEVEKEKKGTARSRGRKGQDDKAAAAEQTVVKGKNADEEDSEEEAEKESEEKEPEENNVPARSRGGRGKGKATPTPTPRSGGRGRSKVSAAEQDEEEQQADSKTEDSEETKDTAAEAEVTPSSRRRGPAKSANAASTPPSSGRRGKAGKTEAAPKTTPASGRSSRRGHGSEEAADNDDAVDGAGDAGEEKEKVEQEGAQEPAAPAEPTKEKGEESTTEKGDELTPAEKEGAESKSEPMEVAESQETSVPGKKRKLEEEEEPESKSPVKKPRLEETENQQSKESNVPAEESVVVSNVQEAPPEQPSTESVESEPGPAEDISTDTPAQDTSAETQQSQSAASESATTEGTNSAAVESEDKSQVSTVGPTNQSSPVKANDSQVSEDLPLPTESTASSVSERSNPAPSDGVALETAMDTTAPIVPQESKSSAPVSDEQTSDAAEVMEVDKPAEVAPTELPSQNGTDEPHVVSPSKSSAAKVYVPSSSAIDSRKFIPNPNFPPELMDPASWFSVVSYNILADCHLCRSDYSFTQPQFLAQDYRHSLLLKELEYLDGDIVCLQEVNPSYFNDTLLPALKSRGYDGQIFKRTKEFYDEGEATLVKLSKFDVVSHQSVSLKDLVYKEIESSTLSEEVSNAVKKYLDRADVILLTELKCKKTDKTLTVCNIHVVYDRLAPDVQSIQVASAIKRLVAQAGSDQNPHIICGDFNSDITSPAYQLARDGYLSDDHIPKLQNLQALDIAEGTSRSLINHLWNAFQHTSSNLKNAYEITLGKDPPITAMSPTSRKLQALDHVFYSSASIDNVGVLETIDVEVVEGCGGIPSKNIPSDHLSVKAVFRLK